MRLLITTHGGAGHFHPLAPIADAAIAAGHEVAFATEPPYHDAITRHGYEAFPVGMHFDFHEPEVAFADIHALDGMEGAMWAMEHVFFGALPEAALPDVARLVDEWRPDVILNETSEIAGLLTAEQRGIPHATFDYGGMDLRLLQYVAGTPWGRLRDRLGLDPDPTFSVMADSLVIAAMPQRWAGDEVRTNVCRVQLPLFDRGGAAHDCYLHVGDAAPLVYATLGTVNRDLEALRDVASGLARSDLPALLTTGPNVDPGTVGLLPSHVRARQYVPQSEVLPRSCAVVHHGGFNTLLGALAHGLPQVILPMDADQPLNAARAAELGVALVIEPDHRSAVTIAEALQRVVFEPTFAQRARELRADLDALPPVSIAVDTLASLTVPS